MNQFDTLLPGWIKATLSVPALISVVVLAVLWFRSGSSHVLWSRLWSFGNGNGKGRRGHAVLQKILDERSSLMEFRVRTGVRARTIEDALRVAQWSNDHGEEIGDVGSCRSYFNVDAVTLKSPPGAALMGVLAVFFSLCLLLVIFLSGLAITARLVTNVPNGGPWVTLGSDGVRMVWSGTRVIPLDCNNQSRDTLSESAKLSRKDADLICSLLLDPNYSSFLLDQLREQRSIAVSVLLFVLAPLYLAQNFFFGAIAARDMAKRIAMRGSLRKEVRNPATAVDRSEE